MWSSPSAPGFLGCLACMSASDGFRTEKHQVVCLVCLEECTVSDCIPSLRRMATKMPTMMTIGLASEEARPISWSKQFALVIAIATTYANCSLQLVCRPPSLANLADCVRCSPSGKHTAVKHASRAPVIRRLHLWMSLWVRRCVLGGWMVTLKLYHQTETLPIITM